MAILRCRADIAPPEVEPVDIWVSAVNVVVKQSQILSAWHKVFAFLDHQECFLGGLGLVQNPAVICAFQFTSRAPGGGGGGVCVNCTIMCRDYCRNMV